MLTRLGRPGLEDIPINQRTLHICGGVSPQGPGLDPVVLAVVIDAVPGTVREVDEIRNRGRLDHLGRSRERWRRRGTTA